MELSLHFLPQIHTKLIYVWIQIALEMEEMFQSDSPFLPNLIVDTALKNLDTITPEIPVIRIYTKDEDLTYDVIIGREDLAETLEVNLENMEDLEDYKRCQKITDAIYYLNTK